MLPLPATRLDVARPREPLAVHDGQNRIKNAPLSLLAIAQQRVASGHVIAKIASRIVAARCDQPLVVAAIERITTVAANSYRPEQMGIDPREHRVGRGTVDHFQWVNQKQQRRVGVPRLAALGLHTFGRQNRGQRRFAPLDQFIQVRPGKETFNVTASCVDGRHARRLVRVNRLGTFARLHRPPRPQRRNDHADARRLDFRRLFPVAVVLVLPVFDRSKIPREQRQRLPVRLLQVGRSQHAGEHQAGS